MPLMPYSTNSTYCLSQTYSAVLHRLQKCWKGSVLELSPTFPRDFQGSQPRKNFEMTVLNYFPNHSGGDT